MRRWLAVLLWMGGMFWLSSIPSLHTPLAPHADFMLSKLAHLGVYAGVTILLFLALEQHVASRRHAWLLAVLLAVGYALTDEWHQTFVPGRQGSLRDVGIDALGMAGGYVLGKAMLVLHPATGRRGQRQGTARKAFASKEAVGQTTTP